MQQSNFEPERLKVKSPKTLGNIENFHVKFARK